MQTNVMRTAQWFRRLACLEVIGKTSYMVQPAYQCREQARRWIIVSSGGMAAAAGGIKMQPEIRISSTSLHKRA
ncbi:hypothetical protein [Paraburkholderia sp. 40]|uniref:hypothetical protein n=1 Tax=Paraburkholderia sp. 40 TaxID=2991059 RepID=UPI003D1AF841